jgi:hypothetical protein
MSASATVVQRLFPDDVAVERSREIPEAATSRAASWNPAQFAREQIQGLVRRVFVPGWPRPARQVVFSAADAETDISRLCRIVSEVLVAERAGNVCVVEANARTLALEKGFGETSRGAGDIFQGTGTARKSSRQISRNLFLVGGSFLSFRNGSASLPWMQARLSELRDQFEFTVIHADWAGSGAGTPLLAHLADGMVLGIAAHRTRRAAAQKLQEHLVSADVRLLGVVLSERTFPIPERLYRLL